MIKAAIIGGAGYTAGELIRLLIHHPDVKLEGIVSQSHEGEWVSAAHPDLTGECSLTFVSTLPDHPDVVFLCSGHGKSKAFLEKAELPAGTNIIDLSSDFRINGSGHSFVYGLPELNREKIQQATNIANPGCFATCIQLSLLPLAEKGLIQQEVHVSAITGSTGAGFKATDTTHFSWRSNNASVYKALNHRHLAEIKQSLQQLQREAKPNIQFIPMRGAFTRGILAASYLENVSNLSSEEVRQLFEEYYAGHPFVHITENSPDVKQVVNTNKCLLHVSTEAGQILVTAVIDNLLKGASGQAVQNMNLMFHLDEQCGLHLKGSAF